MPVSDLLVEGLGLMLIGMGIVFAFLMMLVAVLRLMSGFAGRLSPEPRAVSAASGAPAAEGAGAPDQGELVAVISAAVARYRRGRRG
jgi:oxaloacetate decarboxylase gamma subunit